MDKQNVLGRARLLSKESHTGLLFCYKALKMFDYDYQQAFDYLKSGEFRNSVHTKKHKAIIIYLDNCMLLSKKEYSCWKEVQDEYYESYKANLSPMSCEEIISFFEEDFKQEENWPFSRKEIIDFFESDELIIQSE